jgi:hypothetical protein
MDAFSKNRLCQCKISVNTRDCSSVPHFSKNLRCDHVQEGVGLMPLPRAIAFFWKLSLSGTSSQTEFWEPCFSWKNRTRKCRTLKVPLGSFITLPAHQVHLASSILSRHMSGARTRAGFNINADGLMRRRSALTAARRMEVGVLRAQQDPVPELHPSG